jgi:hypothetical protein
LVCACSSLGDRALGRGRARGGARRVGVRLGDELALEQLLRALVLLARVAERGLRLDQVGPGRGQGRLGARDVGLDQLRVDAGEDVAFLHRRVEVGVELEHAARDLAADLHGLERRQGAARGHGLGDALPADRLGLPRLGLRRGGADAIEHHDATAAGDGERGGPGEDLPFDLHDRGLL